MFKLRNATKDDMSYLLTLRKLTMETYLATSGLSCTDEAHVCRINFEFKHCYLIYKSAQKIGMLKYNVGNNILYIKQLQIHPDFQNSGIGSGLIRQLISSHNPTSVKLSVLKTNPALNLYLRLGFQQYDEDEHEFYMERKSINP